MSNTQLEEQLAGEPPATQAEILSINTDARHIALQVALLVPLLAGLLGVRQLVPHGAPARAQAVGRARGRRPGLTAASGAAPGEPSGWVQIRAHGSLVGWAALALVAPAVAGCGGGAHAPGHVTMTVHAASGLADAPVRIDVRGLRGGERATLDAAWADAGGAVWASRTPVRADGDGAVRLAGVDGMRFLWGMRPRRPIGGPQGFVPRATGASDVRLSLVAGGRTLARGALSRRIAPASVRLRRLTVRRDGVYGYLFSPAGRTRRPAVLAFGGSGGGDTVISDAGLLAAHGYPALALAYFKAPGLPSRLERIPLEYFARAARILRREPAADPRRIVAMGGSYGGEAALLIAATFPRLFHGAIGLVPNVSISPSTESFAIPAWSYRGKGLSPQPIALGRIDAPILTAGAGLDNVWNSPQFVREIVAFRRDAHTRFHDTSVTYAKAGHDVGAAVPYLPAAHRPGALRRHGARVGGGQGRPLAADPALPARPARRLTDGLPDPDQVALAVAKPGAALAAGALARVVALDLGDAVAGDEAGDVVVLEHDAAGAQLREGRLEVLDLEGHLRVLTRRAPGREEDGEVAGPRAVEQPAGALVGRLEAELLRIERAGAVEVLGRQPRGHGAVSQGHDVHDRRGRRGSSAGVGRLTCHGAGAS